MSKKKSRRQFIRKSVVSSAAIISGIPVVYGKHIGYDKLLHHSGLSYYSLPGKDDRLSILNDRPINAETPPHLLNDALTPNRLFFVRNNGIPPQNPSETDWILEIGGEAINNPYSISLAELKREFKTYNYKITLECGGNGRKEFYPPAKGNQWSTGAVGCAEWTGVRLADVLKKAGVKSSAKYIGYYGKDTHISGDPSKVVISRGVPIEKAMDEHSLIAWSMNGEDIPLLNGYPLRLVFGGYPASASGKWLNKIVVRDIEHDGPKMTGQSYRVPCEPVAPGAKVADEDMCIITKMPVKSLITYPKTGAMLDLGRRLNIEGKAWTAADRILQVEWSIDFGATWNKCSLTPADNKFQWQSFKASIDFPQKGYYEVWAKATDSDGKSQPTIVPGWNPRGYLNNACHRIAVKIV